MAIPVVFEFVKDRRRLRRRARDRAVESAFRGRTLGVRAFGGGARRRASHSGAVRRRDDLSTPRGVCGANFAPTAGTARNRITHRGVHVARLGLASNIAA